MEIEDCEKIVEPSDNKVASTVLGNIIVVFDVGNLVCICEMMILVFNENSWVEFNIIELDKITFNAEEVKRNGSVVEDTNVEKFVVENVE